MSESQKQKMLSGKPYTMLDAELQHGFELCRTRRQRFNTTGEGVADLLPNCGERVTVVAPFYCDYGENITIGDDVFINSGVTMLDCAPITIGNHVLIGPGVKLCAATHPIDYMERRQWEYALPIVVEDDVWIGAGAIICPGVRIGARSVVAAGAVVIRDVVADSMVAGNPAQIKKMLNTVDDQ